MGFMHGVGGRGRISIAAAPNMSCRKDKARICIYVQYAIATRHRCVLHLKHAQRTPTSLCVENVETFLKKINMFQYLRIRSNGGVCRTRGRNPTSHRESAIYSRHWVVVGTA
jgi:hypothetical protein